MKWKNSNTGSSSHPSCHSPSLPEALRLAADLCITNAAKVLVTPKGIAYYARKLGAA